MDLLSIILNAKLDNHKNVRHLKKQNRQIGFIEKSQIAKMILKKRKCNLTFNLSKLSYSEICSIAQLRAAILALSILWGGGGRPLSRRGDGGILHLLPLLLKNERELALMYLLNLNMNAKYALML
jgi:hypothetical protein